MWLVGINRPYYPSVKIYTEYDLAIKAYEELFNEHEEDGGNEVIVFICNILEYKEIKTHY